MALMSASGRLIYVIGADKLGIETTIRRWKYLNWRCGRFNVEGYGCLPSAIEIITQLEEHLNAHLGYFYVCRH